MRKKTIERCIQLCIEFQERAKILANDEEKMRLSEIGFGSKESGALRRISLELSSSLVDLRQNR